jgi:hypothetical protein
MSNLHRDKGLHITFLELGRCEKTLETNGRRNGPGAGAPAPGPGRPPLWCGQSGATSQIMPLPPLRINNNRSSRSV